MLQTLTVRSTLWQCFVVAAVCFVAMVFWLRYLGDRALVPPKIFKSFSIYAICITAFMTRCSMLILSFYIPIYYQVAKHHSATKSGIDIIALMLATVIGVIATGRIVGAWGHYKPFLVLGPLPGAIGAGLLYTLSSSTPNGEFFDHFSLYLIRLTNESFSISSEHYWLSDSGRSRTRYPSPNVSLRE